MFERLDYIYQPSGDVAADVAHYTDTLGGRLVFAIEAMGTRVAMLTRPGVAESFAGRRDF